MPQSVRVLMRPLAAAVLTATWLLSVPAANAQAQSQSPSSPGPSDQTPNIPDQKLNAAAAALEQVASVKNNYQQRIEAAAPLTESVLLMRPTMPLWKQSPIRASR